MTKSTFEKELEVSKFKGTQFARFMDYTLEDVLKAKKKDDERKKKEIFEELDKESEESNVYQSHRRNVDLEIAKEIIERVM